MSQCDDAGPVLVGYDESPASEQALRWAVEEARLRDLPLEICHTWQWPYPFRTPEDPMPGGAETLTTLEVLRSMAAIVADEGVRKAHAMAKGLDVRWRLEQGFAPAALLSASHGASLVVLGARGHGGFDGLSIGSVAMQVPAHSTRPVIVVRSAPPHFEDGGQPIVVGVDGSPASDAALGFAFQEAALRDVPLTAVCAWWDPGLLPGPDRAPFIRPEPMRHEAMTRFEQFIERWQVDFPKVPVDMRFVVETPRHAIISAALGAVLLVVGNIGIGSAPHTLLGSVTQTAMHEASCPVAIVPATAGRRDRSEGSSTS
ncbi:universal stress protein [Actinomadura sp. HBU206391]|uniref:universal stress protein n=1 Tax=Actinomadura sp. HBU206391 TaxID=2731692 RepID=UPI0016506C4C|nr:universal stress protein [Actinomadura sp. HBU206391]MBC6462216.1 universal stress protein [Actinomadura sp. HBU206391]